MFKDLIEKRNLGGTNYANYVSLDTNTTSEDVLSEPTYVKCIMTIANSIAKVGCNLTQETDKGISRARNHYLFDLIKNRPNPYMSAIDVFRSLVSTALHLGDGFLLIARDSRGKVTGLYPITVINLVVDNIGLIKTKKQNAIMVNYTCNSSGQVYQAKYSDVIHLKCGLSFDGLTTRSIKDMLSETIKTNNEALKYQSELFGNGMSSKLAIQMLSDIRDEKKLNAVMASMTKLWNTKSPFIPIPAGYKVESLSMKLSDSQFVELKNMGAKQIASAFGVPQFLLNDLSDVNNNSLEMSNLHFLSNCLMIIFKSIENEMDYKLLTTAERKQGYSFEFNIQELLRVDMNTQCSIVTKYLTSGLYTIDDARLILGMEKLPDGAGENIIIPSGYCTLNNLLNGEVSYINKGSNVETTQTVEDKSSGEGGDIDGKQGEGN